MKDSEENIKFMRDLKVAICDVIQEYEDMSLYEASIRLMAVTLDFSLNIGKLSPYKIARMASIESQELLLKELNKC